MNMMQELRHSGTSVKGEMNERMKCAKYQKIIPDDVRNALDVISIYRKKNGISQRYIAGVLDVVNSTFYHWEHKHHVPDEYYHDRIREYAREIVQ